MRFGDLKTLFIVALVMGGGAYLADTGALGRAASSTAETANGALAYFWDDEAVGVPAGTPEYYDPLPAYAEVIAPPDAIIPDGPYYWPAGSDVVDAYANDPNYYDPYSDPYADTIVIDEPWYESYFPGVGHTLSYLLPPIAQSRPISRPPAPPRPTCEIVASPQSVAFGGSTLVSWSSSGSARSVLSGVGDVPGTGSRVYGDLTASQSFALSVSGLGGSSTCSTSVYVQQSDVQPTCDIAANPSTIRRGETANIAWLSNNAVSARLSGEGSVSQTGGRVVAPTQTTTYSLTVYSRGGKSGSCAAQVTVQ